MNKTIDLHGIKHADVAKKMDDFLYQMINKKVNEAYVVTGHSKQMKKIVREVLEEYNINATEDFLNKGMLVLDLK
jgi:DNA-nicking Smr family endonuclease